MERNESGDWSVVPLSQPEAATNNRFVAMVDEAADQRQPQPINPMQNAVGRQVNDTSKTYDIFTLKRWNLDLTIDRVQVCLWMLILMMKIISTLAVISFWLAVLFCLKSLPGWQGPQRVITGYVRRRDFINNQHQIPANDHFLEDLFPFQDRQLSFQLLIAFAHDALAENAVLNVLVPILVDDPIVCLMLMLLAFIINHAATFTHGCLRQANHAVRTLAKRRRTA